VLISWRAEIIDRIITWGCADIGGGRATYEKLAGDVQTKQKRHTKQKDIATRKKQQVVAVGEKT